MRTMAGYGMLLFVVMAAGVSCAPVREDRVGIIRTDGAPVYRKCDFLSKQIGFLPLGERVDILGSAQTTVVYGKNVTWYPVQKRWGVRGYISSTNMAVIPEEKAKILPYLDYDIAVRNDELVFSRRDTKAVIFRRALSAEDKKYRDYSVDKQVLYPYLLISKRLSFAIIYDLEKSSVTAHLEGYYSPHMIEISPARRYLSIDDGTAAAMRGLSVLDLARDAIVYGDAYDTLFRPQWQGETLTYYRPLGSKVPGKPPLDPNARNNNYSRKILWKNGTVVKTDEYQISHAE